MTRLRRWSMCRGVGTLALLLHITLGTTTSVASTSSPATLPPRLLVGYWHNFNNGSGIYKLRDVPDAYDVINVAFAVPTVLFGSTLQFSPDPSIYPNPGEFKDDIALLQSRGKAVLISIGGATGPIHMDDSSSISEFVQSLRNIIESYGFDGLDIDLEGTSLFLSPGDWDFRAPITPRIVNFITAVQELTDQLDSGYVLSAAPETAYVQGGYKSYSGVYGAYLPVLHALRDRLAYVHVQHYNSGSMFGRDGTVYFPETADFHTAMADALLAGFTVDVNGAGIEFEPFPAEKVLIGLPASPLAAGSGFTPVQVVQQSLDYLILGREYGGQYTIGTPAGYPGFRGLMTWSINWDIYAGATFSDPYRSYLDNLSIPSSVTPSLVSTTPRQTALLANYPNPFNPSTTIGFTLARRSYVRLSVMTLLGQELATLIEGEREPGSYSTVFDARNLAAGVYLYRLTTADAVQTERMVLLK